MQVKLYKLFNLDFLICKMKSHSRVMANKYIDNYDYGLLTLNTHCSKISISCLCTGVSSN